MFVTIIIKTKVKPGHFKNVGGSKSFMHQNGVEIIINTDTSIVAQYWNKYSTASSELDCFRIAKCELFEIQQK